MSISFWLFFVFAKNIIPYPDNFPRWRFFVTNNISLDLWVFVIFVGLSLDLWVFRYPYGGNRYPIDLGIAV